MSLRSGVTAGPRRWLDRIAASAREPGAPARAARTGVCLATPVAVGLAVGEPASGAVASLGGFVGWYAHREPYRRRAGLLACLALGFAAAVALGTLAAPTPLAAALVPGAFAAVATLVCVGLELAPPREYLLVLVCLAATGLPADPGAWASRAGLALAGAAFAWLLTMSGWLRRPQRPERYALGAALERVAALLEEPGAPDRRRDAVRAVRSARHAVLRAGPGRAELRAATAATEEMLSAALGLGYTGDTTAAERRAEAALRALERRPRRDGRPPGGGATAPAGPAAPSRRAAPVAEEPAPLPAWQMLRAAVAPHSVAVPTAARMGIAVAAAGAVGAALHATNGYWIPLTVAAALQGVSPLHARRRALERAGGTAVGAALAAGLLALGPAPGVVVAAMAVLQTLTELVVPAVYALGVMILTPIPLLLLHVADPATTAEPFVAARVLDTAIGAAIALLALAVIWPGAAGRRLGAAERRGFAAAADLILALVEEPGSAAARQVAERRRRAQGALVAMRSLVDASLGERGAVDAAAAEGPGVERLLMLTIGAAAGRHTLRPESARAELAAALAAIAATLPERSAAVQIPDLPGLPRTTAELRRLSRVRRPPRG